MFKRSRSRTMPCTVQRRMKAVRLIKSGSPLEEQEIRIPAVGAHDVLIRVKAAGICHSDAHYRAGVSPVEPLPLTLGHEVAGVVEETGAEVEGFPPGDRVCVHYLVTCGQCAFCEGGTEQFCPTVQMIGKHRDGGYAEFIVVPERSVFRLPDEIPFEQGAILMCSSATSLHALNKARLRPGETVAVFGVGGLGISAVQLARHFGAAEVFAVDINPRKLELAERFGAIPVNASGRRSRRATSRADARPRGGCRAGIGRLAADHASGRAIIGDSGPGRAGRPDAGRRSRSRRTPSS